MKTIEIDDELYAFIASQTKHIGESACEILRRLLIDEPGIVTTVVASGASIPAVSAALAEAEATPEPAAATPAKTTPKAKPAPITTAAARAVRWRRDSGNGGAPPGGQDRIVMITRNYGCVSI